MPLIEIQTNVEEEELVEKILRLLWNSNIKDKINEIQPYDCIKHKVKRCLECIDTVVKRISILEPVVLCQKDEEYIVLRLIKYINSK